MGEVGLGTAGRGRIAVGFGGSLGVGCGLGGRRVWGRLWSECAADGRPGGGSSCLDPFRYFGGWFLIFWLKVLQKDLIITNLNVS